MEGGAGGERTEGRKREEKEGRYIFVGNKARKSLTHQLRRPLGKVKLFYDGFISTDY